MAYKHKIVEGLASLIDKYGGKSKDPMMSAIWWGIKGQIPSILQSLDENEEAIAEIREKLMEVLDLKPQITEVSLIEEEVKAEEQTGEFAPVAEMEIAVEPAEEEAPLVAGTEVTLEPVEKKKRKKRKK